MLKTPSRRFIFLMTLVTFMIALFSVLSVQILKDKTPTPVTQLLPIDLPSNIPTETIPTEPTETYILLGDTGSGNSNQQAVADAVETYCSDLPCKAVFILGDIIYEEGISSVDDPLLKSRFETQYQNIDLPFYLMLGNHDNLGCISCLSEYAELSDKVIFPEYYYTVKESPNISFYVTNSENFSSSQQTWLEQELAQNSTPFSVVLGHRGIISNETSKYGENWVGKDELAKLVCSQADIYASGHAHLLEDTGVLPGCTTRLLTSGAGGAYLRDVVQPYEGEFFALEYGFVALHVNSKMLKYEFVSAENGSLYSGSIKK